MEVAYVKNTMPFGKYRGVLISTLIQKDPEYLQWFINKYSRIHFSSKVKEAVRVQLWLAQ
jgi:uncharacterized protein (DUF3820 family)